MRRESRSDHRRFKKSIVALLSFFLACAAHIFVRYPSQPRVPVPDIRGQVESLSYNPSAGPVGQDFGSSTNAEMDRDLSAISRVTGRIRTYSVAGSLAAVPAIAKAHGLSISLGMWINARQPAFTVAEIARGILIANKQRNVTEIYVGNETLLRGDATVEQLRRLMREVRLRTGKPVTTGESWDTWIKYPELVKDADFIGAHILPYWEGVSAEKAVRAAFGRYDLLSKAFPKKRIVISEFGWPSGRLNHYAAFASAANQAQVLREFVAEARRRQIDYNIVEAVDQPWKVQEGDVGQFWGVFDAEARPKFSWQGPLPALPWWRIQLAIGILIGLFGQVALSRIESATFAQYALSGPCSQMIGYAAAEILTAPFNYYLSSGYIMTWGFALPLIVLLLITSADRLRELSQFLIGRAPTRLITFPGKPERATAGQGVSIHVPVCNEAPEIVAMTLGALAKLEYDDYEVLVLANNCSSAELPARLLQICQQLGSRFRMIDLGHIGGFKAGALNAGLRHTAPGVEIIAIVDADYIVSPNWLRRLRPSFIRPEVALVQAPQEHRDTSGHWFRFAMNVEYGTFFDIGMVQRNEHNAIIAHGTMLMVRRTALEQVGGWDETCICEDTELGLRLLLAGWRSEYTSTRMGAGLLPADLTAYRIQRQRWAFGAMSILRKHWRAICSPSSSLTLGQRYHFLLGWSHWIADGIGLALAILNLCWFAAMTIFGYGSPPPEVVSVAVLAAATISIWHALALLTLRPGISFVAAGQAVVCALALQMPVARAIVWTLLGYDYPFIVTAKGHRRRTAIPRITSELWPDMMLGTALIAGAAILLLTNRYQVIDIGLFAIVMAVQSAPYVASSLLGLSSLMARRPSLGAPLF